MVALGDVCRPFPLSLVDLPGEGGDLLNANLGDLALGAIDFWGLVFNFGNPANLSLGDLGDAEPCRIFFASFPLPELLVLADRKRLSGALGPPGA